MEAQLAIQLTGLIVVFLWSAAVSFVLAKLVRAVTGLKVGCPRPRSKASISGSTASAATICK
jgi:ammonia channel protein AmtB